MRIVADQWGSPTYTNDLAEIIIHIIQSRNNRFGIYNFTNEGRTNWFKFAEKINQYGMELGLIKKDTPVIPITSSEYPTPAKRPANSWLSKEKIKSELNISIREWETALRDFMEREIDK